MPDRIKTVFRGRIINVGLERFALPDGREVELEIVRHPGGAAVVALDAGNRACLVRQYRHAADGWLWELPAGKIDHGEAPDLTAQRELAEEAGMKAGRWRSLGLMHSSPGVFDEIIHLYLATDLHPVGQALEADELLEVHWVELPVAREWAATGEITDAKTVIGLYRAIALHERTDFARSADAG